VLLVGTVLSVRTVLEVDAMSDVDVVLVAREAVSVGVFRVVLLRGLSNEAGENDVSHISIYANGQRRFLPNGEEKADKLKIGIGLIIEGPDMIFAVQRKKTSMCGKLVKVVKTRGGMESDVKGVQPDENIGKEREY
jgi:hypothetical protein